MVLGPEASTLTLCRKWLKMQILGFHPRPGAWHCAIRSPPAQILMVLRTTGGESHSGTKHNTWYLTEKISTCSETCLVMFSTHCLYTVSYCPRSYWSHKNVKYVHTREPYTSLWDIFYIKRKMLQLVTPIVLCRVIPSWLLLDKGHQGKLLIR